MKIGAVAQRSGVTVDAVRFYERRGILPPAKRRKSGYRMYTTATVERIRLTRSLQALGFSLDEVLEVLRAVDEGTATCKSQEPRFEAVLQRIDEKVAELLATRRQVAGALDRCRSGRCTFREEAMGGCLERKTS